MSYKIFSTRSAWAGIAVFICLFFSTKISFAQDCACEESLDAVISGLEENYSLFKYKVNDSNREVYHAYKEVIRQQAMIVDDFEDCKYILNNYLKFFRDGHVWLNFPERGEKVYEQISVGEEMFKNMYLESEKQPEDILGIWESGSYRVAIIEEEDPSGKSRDYIGVILDSENSSWKPEEIKFTLKKVYGNDYKATFFMGDHSPKFVNAKQKNEGLLEFEKLNDWNKVWPSAHSAHKKKAEEMAYVGFHFEIMEGGIPYFRFPDFDLSSIESLKNVLEEFHNQIIQAPYMVVDVRKNSGGYDSAYHPLMPYILTGPIEMPNVFHYMSAYNKTLMGVDVAEEDIDDLEDEEDKALYRLFYSSIDTLITFGDEYYTYSPDTIYEQPNRIAVLTSKSTVSSGETFVLRSKKSPRVIVYGQNTAGIIDGFNGSELELGCVTLRYPQSVRALDVDKNPIDPHGIAPDVFLEESVDALEFAMQHMKQLLKVGAVGAK